MKRIRFIAVLAAALVITVAPQAVPGATYDIVAPQSTIEVAVFSGGPLGVFGHDHLIAAEMFSGSARFNPGRLEASTLTLTVAADSLTVLDPGLPEQDRSEVQATMLGAEVLAVESFPRIIFRSSGVRDIRPVESGWEMTLTGRLTLHGVEQPISFPLRVWLDNGRLYGQGEVSLVQSKFGIRPLRIAGGLVRVKDRVRVRFTVAAAQGEP
jgi:polyisoprenoid-binding protein YceI